ncbi:MAG: MurR/RpiR family transcriptional regulator [Alphaproteobacteria bacterium]|nr:MurR/RpiR family transcriptional regulator [Alphaproteobacteria bacterium]
MDLRDRIEQMSKDFTSAERKLASALLSDYPFAGLETIQSFAQKTHTSAPSITRFVQKLGINGYQEFQRQLIGELKESKLSPVQLRRGSMPVKDSFLREHLNDTSQIVASVSDGVTATQFERVCGLLADQKRAIYFLGGRISDPILQYLSRHLRQIRQNVFHLPADTEVWPEYLLRMRPRDIFVTIDFRRYEARLEELSAKIANKRGSQIILLTDKWLSPVARHANEVLTIPIESASAWGTYSGALALTEAMITYISEQDWDATEKRIGQWDALRLDNEDVDLEE